MSPPCTRFRPEFVVAQLEAVFSDIGVDAAKTGMLFSQPIIEAVAESSRRTRCRSSSTRCMVASSGAQLLRADAVAALVGLIFPLAAVITPNLLEAQALTGSPAGVGRKELAERLVDLGAPAAIVTGGHGDDAVDHLFDGNVHVEIPVERFDSGATHGAGCTHSATLAAGLARGLSLVDAARAAAAAASAAVHNGLASIGAGDGPVDVFNLKGSP